MLLVLNFAMPVALVLALAPYAYCRWPCCDLCRLLMQAYWTLQLSGTALVGYNQTKCTDHRLIQACCQSQACVLCQR